jgi:hypothetical protein
MAKRVVLGKKGSDFVLQISKSGVDVIDDNPNTRDLLFNSLNNYRSGVIVSDTTITGTMSSSGVALPTTADSSAAAYIPAYQIIEKGVKSNFTQFQETTNLSFAGIQHTLSATVAGALPTSAGGGMFELSLDGSGSTLNLVRPTLFDITEVENPTGSVNGNYPYIEYRSRGSSDGNVDILALRIPCQYGKMTNNAALFGNSELTPSATGGGGSGGAGAVSAPADPTVTLSSRNNTNDTVVVSSSSGSGNSGTITFVQTSTNVIPTSGFTTTTTYTQPRNSTRYYWASQSSTVSGSTAFVSPAVDTSPNAFTFTDVANVSRNSTNTSNTITISGMGTGDTATVSLSGTAGSKQYSKNGGAYTSSSGTAANGDTFAVKGTASGSYSTAVTVILTVGSTADTYSITTEGEPADTTPSAFDFTNQSNLNLSTLTYSNTVTISGINQSVSVSATNGAQFSINGGGYTTSGSISNGQSLRVRLTSSGSYNTGVSTTVTVGGTSDVWLITTRTQAQATTPTFQGVTLQTNTSSSSQTVRAAAVVQSGNTLQIKVGSGGSWANATSTYSSDFSQNRNTSVTYYFRAVSTDGHISSEVSASLFIPPVHTVQAIADLSFTNGSHDNTYSVTNTLNGATAGLYTSKSFSITESASWITATIANSTTGTMRLQISANTGIARSANVTYTISSTNGGPNVSASFTVSQAAVTPPVTAIWEVNIAQGAYSPSASFNSQGYHPFTGGGHGSFSNTTNTIASINSGGGNWAFSDIETSNANTIFLIFTSSAANSGWTTLKVYNGTNTSGTLLGTFTRTSLTYTGTGGTAAWDLGSDVTTSTGNRFLQFS